MPLPAFPKPFPPLLSGLSRCTIPSLLLLLLSFLLLLFDFLHHPNSGDPRTHSRSTPDFHQLFLAGPSSGGSNSTISAHLRTLTLRPHLAGTPSAVAVAHYVFSHFRLAGFRTLTRDYTALLSYPAYSSLSLHFPGGAGEPLPLPLSEPHLEAGVVPPYHAYSPSGAAFALPLYANYGREEDYRKLVELGVDVKGCVVVVRKGGGPRGAVVERAAEKGAAAVLMYREVDAGDRVGVERGTVLMGSVGDPLTPGWAATAGGDGERLEEEDGELRRRFPRIPSMPVPVVTAEQILKTLGGPVVPEEWRGSLQLSESSGVGRGPTMVNFTYLQDRKLATIRNVFGIIRGKEEPDRYIVLGNHRDAWTYGAVDPNSGTAVLLDIARRFSFLLRSGWRPRRTIILASWDAEEFGMIGSTEWVEQNLGDLSSKAVAYLNVDCAVQGPGFFVSATPQLDDLLVEVTKKVKDPDALGMTVYQNWVAANGGVNIERLSRADSDFSAFLHHAGVPSIDLYFGSDFPVYHTAFDSYDWMKKYGDPLFHRHVAVAEIWGLLALRLADDPVVPFNYLSYSAQLQEHTNELHALLDGGESLQPVNTSIGKLTAAANEVQVEARNLLVQENLEDCAKLRLRAFNDRLMLAERSFLDAEGLKGRQWFKHVIYSPPADYESKLSFFPGIADAITDAHETAKGKCQKVIEHEVWRVARAIERAANALRGKLP